MLKSNFQNQCLIMKIVGFYMGLCMLFGPIFFILHTFCYEKSAVKLHLKTGLSFYKPCPQKQSEVDESNKDTKVDLRAKHPVCIVNLDDIYSFLVNRPNYTTPRHNGKSRFAAVACKWSDDTESANGLRTWNSWSKCKKRMYWSLKSLCLAKRIRSTWVRPNIISRSLQLVDWQECRQLQWRRKYPIQEKRLK